MLIPGRCRDISPKVHLGCHRGRSEGDLGTVIADPLQRTYEFISSLSQQSRENPSCPHGKRRGAGARREGAPKVSHSEGI